MSKKSKLDEFILRWWERSRDELQDLADYLAGRGWSKSEIVRVIRADIEESIPLIGDFADALIEPANPLAEAVSDAGIGFLLELLERRLIARAMSSKGRQARREGSTLARRRARMRADVVRRPAVVPIKPAGVPRRTLIPRAPSAEVPTVITGPSEIK